ncbi:hypothetical protein [Nesterenkonia sp.]|uniref:hypothetical protein n=1 Tax=Nesterenkonia sp. TaxID=704201 RepID=UPI00261763DF|nr:hypothetical protein [Nesterenkonia sp.]
MVSAAGERTLRSCAALALAVGLTISAASATYASTLDPDPTGPSPTDSQETADPDPNNTLDSQATTEPTPDNGTTEPSPEDPTSTPPDTPGEGDPTGESPSPTPGETDGEDADEDDYDDAGETTGALAVTCDSDGRAGVDPGETVTLTCYTTEEATLGLGNSQSQIGGSVELSGNQLTYTAPAEAYGTPQDTFTVVATPPEGEEAEAQVIFTVYGTESPSPTPVPTPTEPDPTDQPSATTPPDPTGKQDPTDGQGVTEFPTSPPAGEPTTVAPEGPSVPGTPHGGSEQEGLSPLPVPGSPWNEIGPGSDASGPSEVSSEPEEDDEPNAAERDDAAADPGELAQTGDGRALWAGVLAFGAAAMGLLAVLLTHRASMLMLRRDR